MWNILSLCPAGQSVEVAKQITWKNALLQTVALWQVQKDQSGRTPFKCEPGKPWLSVSDSLVLPGCEKFLPEKDFRQATDSLKMFEETIDKYRKTSYSFFTRTLQTLTMRELNPCCLVFLIAHELIGLTAASMHVVWVFNVGHVTLILIPQAELKRHVFTMICGSTWPWLRFRMFGLVDALANQAKKENKHC